MKYVMAASTATTTAINRTINIGDLNGFGGRSDIALPDVATPTPHAGGARPSLERGGGCSNHPRDVRLRRAAMRSARCNTAHTAAAFGGG